MSKVKTKQILKRLAKEEGEVKKDFMPQGEHFNWYSDNYLVHSLTDRTYMTQWFVDTETSYIDMSITVSNFGRFSDISNYVFKPWSVETRT